MKKVSLSHLSKDVKKVEFDLPNGETFIVSESQIYSTSGVITNNPLNKTKSIINIDNANLFFDAIGISGGEFLKDTDDEQKLKVFNQLFTLICDEFTTEEQKEAAKKLLMSKNL